MKKMPVNQKLDILASLVIVMSLIIVFLMCALLGVKSEWIDFFRYSVIIIGASLPALFRRRKQFKKFDQLRQILNLSIEEVRAMAGIGRYDLVDWQWKNAFISLNKLYRLEDQLDKKYIEKFGQDFVLTKDLSAHASENA